MKNGQIHIYTGDGKGKTTAAMGLAFRASAYDKKIYILQFLKGRKTGERLSAEKFDNITFERANKSKKFFIQMNEEEKKEQKEEIKEIWNKINDLLENSDYEIIIFDEIMGAISNGMVEIEDVKELLENKGKDKELLLTGRNAPQDLIDMADYVTEMKMIKHPFTKNIPAREGIEY
ncbi:MAG TPA: cob(I)yrinic acid a,c-diamide adenosyltransferase [Halanaerobiales bacterium]|nr:cob(I)yrinic acid a,c-diamide adenosyltransferase [Halanaerobiales bacterium]